MANALHSLSKCLTFILLCVSVSLFAQVGNPYKLYTLLKDGFHQHQMVSTNNGIQIKKQVQNGTIQVQFISNNNYRINYTPNTGFIGTDTLVVEFWNFINPAMMAPFFEHIVYDVRAIIPTPDYMTIRLNESDVFVDVLENDLSSGQLSIGEIYFTSDFISVEVVDDLLKINPLEPGTAYVKYQICDDQNHCVMGMLTIIVEDLSYYDTIFVQDFTLRGRPHQMYVGAGEYQVILNPAHGNVAVDNGLLIYSPNNTFTGLDQFKLERTIGQDSLQLVVVEIRVLPFTEPTRMVIPDRVFTSQNDPIEFNVLINDLITDRPIQSFTQPTRGVLTYLGNGDFIYTPNFNYTGTDQFTYRVCAINNMNCETARVDIRIDNFLPEKGVYTFTTGKNQPYVLQYDVPIYTYDFEILESPFQGSLEYFEGHQTITLEGQEVQGYNMLVYYPPLGYSGIDEMRIQYCAGGVCRSIKIYIEVLPEETDDCVSVCVWPGDTNKDGEVNVFDALSVGFYHGKAGSERSVQQPEIFVPLSSDDWPWNQTNGANLKHIDADGDGQISIGDVQYIEMFYNKHNQLKPVTLNPLAQVPFILECITPEVEIGETAVFNIHVGASQYPAIDFSGLAFQLNLGHGGFFDTSTLQLTLFNDSWLAKSGPALTMAVKPSGDQLDGAVARLDGHFRSGFGIIGKFEGTIVRDITGFHLSGDFIDVPISVIKNEVVDRNGNAFSLPSENTVVRVKIGKTSKYAKSGLLLFPNPSSDYVVVKTLHQQSLINEIQVFNLAGHVVYTERIPGLLQSEISLGHLPASLYIIKVLTDDGVYTSKVQINK